MPAQNIIQKFSEPALVAEMDDRVAGGLWEYEAKIVSEYVPAGGKVLDVGCGGGREALALAKHGYEVHAVDMVAAQLDRARENARREGLCITFELTDGVTIPFENVEFDVVVLWTQVLGNMARPEDRLRLLNSCRGALGDGGVLSATVHEREFCTKEWPADTGGGWLYPWGRDHLRYKLFTEAEFVDLLSAAGFDIVEVGTPSSQPAVLFGVARRQANNAVQTDARASRR